MVLINDGLTKHPHKTGMYKFGYQFVVTVSSLLIACGGAGTATDGSSLPDTGTNTPITGRQVIPSAGIATYAGFMSLNLPVDAGRTTVVGDLSLSVDFGANGNQLSGLAQQFTLDGNTLAGRVFVTDGQIVLVAHGSEVEANISGALTGTGMSNTLVTGEVLGVFSGENGRVISGTAFGDVTTASGIDVFDGTISVARP